MRSRRCSQHECPSVAPDAQRRFPGHNHFAARIDRPWPPTRGSSLSHRTHLWQDPRRRPEAIRWPEFHKKKIINLSHKTYKEYEIITFLVLFLAFNQSCKNSFEIQIQINCF